MAEFTVFAHRGASGEEPENTLRAVRRALDLGARWIEVDVRLVQGEPVVIHDLRLERTTDGEGYVGESTLEHLRSLDAGRGERVPLLTEVLDLVADRAGLNLELKCRGAAGPVAATIQRYVARHRWSYPQTLVSSFLHPELAQVRRLRPEIRIGALTVGVPCGYARFAEELGAHSLHADAEFLGKDLVEDAHRRGLQVFVYVVNQREEYRRIRELGADGAFTDYPERILAWAGR